MILSVMLFYVWFKILLDNHLTGIQLYFKKNSQEYAHFRHIIINLTYHFVIMKKYP